MLFIKVSKIHNVHEMVLLYVLFFSSVVINMRYMSTGKMKIKNNAVLLLLLNLVEDAPAAKTITIMRDSDPLLYTASENDILLMIETADLSVKMTV